MAADRHHLTRAGMLWGAALVAVSFLMAVWHVAGSQPVVSLERLAEFREVAPFQHRVLVPAMVAAVGAITGASVQARYLATECAGWLVLFTVATLWTRSLTPAISPWASRLTGLSAGLAAGAQLLAPVRFRTFGGDTPIGDINGLVHGATRVVTLPNVYYPWDVWSAALVVSVAAMLLAIRERPTAGRLTAGAALFVASSLNRETAVLVVPLSLWALSPRLPRARLALVGIGEVSLWALVMWALAHVTSAAPNPKANLPGGAYEWYLWTNLRTLTYPLYALTALVPFAAGAWVIPLVWWRQAPAPARALLGGYVAPALVAAGTFGILLEARVFTESAAVLWMAAVLTVHARGALPPGDPRG